MTPLVRELRSEGGDAAYRHGRKPDGQTFRSTSVATPANLMSASSSTFWMRLTAADRSWILFTPDPYSPPRPLLSAARLPRTAAALSCRAADKSIFATGLGRRPLPFHPPLSGRPPRTNVAGTTADRIPDTRGEKWFVTVGAPRAGVLSLICPGRRGLRPRHPGDSLDREQKRLEAEMARWKDEDGQLAKQKDDIGGLESRSRRASNGSTRKRRNGTAWRRSKIWRSVAVWPTKT